MGSKAKARRRMRELAAEFDGLQRLSLGLRCEWLAETYLAITYAESIIGPGRDEEYRRSRDCRYARAVSGEMLQQLHSLMRDEGLRTTMTSIWLDDLLTIFHHQDGWQARDEFVDTAVRLGRELESMQSGKRHPNGRIARPGWVRDEGRRPASPRIVTDPQARRFRS